MLRFHFLNVGHGDSTIVEFVDENGEHHFGVVDSNKKGQETSPALRRLQALGALKLSFVALTHPHADHYRGMYEILRHYRGVVDHGFTFPIDRELPRLRKWAENYGDLVYGAVNHEFVDEVEELLKIVVAFREMGDSWEPLSNFGARVHIASMKDVNASLVLPPSAVKGEFFSNIAEGKSALRQDKNNDLSLAIKFEYAGRTVIVGGDGTHSNWIFVRRRTPTSGQEEFGSLNADCVRLPHHGSKRDSGPIVLDYVYGATEVTGGSRDSTDSLAADDRVAIISADGRTHPDPEVLAHLREKNVLPFCTNLSRVCSGAVPMASVSSHTVDEVLVRFVSSVAEPTSRPATCQGDITLTIDDTGRMTIDREFEVACPFRGELSFAGVA